MRRIANLWAASHALPMGCNISPHKGHHCRILVRRNRPNNHTRFPASRWPNDNGQRGVSHMPCGSRLLICQHWGNTWRSTPTFCHLPRVTKECHQKIADTFRMSMQPRKCHIRVIRVTNVSIVDDCIVSHQQPKGLIVHEFGTRFMREKSIFELSKRAPSVFVLGNVHPSEKIHESRSARFKRLVWHVCLHVHERPIGWQVHSKVLVGI